MSAFALVLSQSSGCGGRTPLRQPSSGLPHPDRRIGRGGDVVAKCTGVAEAIPEGLEMARRGGVYFVAGVFADVGDILVNPHGKRRSRQANRKTRRLFWLGRGSAARCPWRRDHVRISSLRRWLLNSWVHLFRMDDSVRPAQLFAQVLGRCSRIGARRSLIWRRAGRLGEGRAGDEDDAGDNHAKS